MEQNQIIATLNQLIQTCKDEEEGFRTCAEDVGDLKLKSFFADRSQECAAAARALQDTVRTLGGEPETESSFGAALHRRWIDIKSLVTGKDDGAILTECERGEDMALRTYRTAIEQGLPFELHEMIERQYQAVLHHHNLVKTMRDQLAGVI